MRKTYVEARTPYQRFLNSRGSLPEQREALEGLYRSLNSVRLLAQINQELEKLWASAHHPEQKEASVTSFTRQSSPVR